MAEKQQKVIKKINHSVESGKKTPLGTKPNDECYTSMQDILNELTRWAELGKFRGKNIICPCDWDIVDGEEIYGVTITYKDNDEIELTTNNIAKAVKEITYDLWGEYVRGYGVVQGYEVETVKVGDDAVEDFLKNKLTCNFIRTLTQNARRWGIKSITASGYNPANGKGTPFQDIDYSKYDICITNPPFSLYAEFMDCVVDKIDFILLAPFLNRVTPNIGLPLMLKKCYLGFGRELALNFINPTSENKYNTKSVACDWIVSWDDAQIEVNNNYKPTGVSYEIYRDEYPVYTEITMKDGTHPIRVPSSQYPEDYDGWMICSINLLDKVNQDLYEWYGTNFKKYYNTENQSANPFAHLASDKMMYLNGKQTFHGIVFRKRRKDN